MEFGLVEDPPPARSAVAFIEWWSQLADEPCAGACVPGRGARVGVERAADEFGDDVFRGVEHVLVRGGGDGRGGGGARLAHCDFLPRSVGIYITQWEMSARPDMGAGSVPLTHAEGLEVNGHGRRKRRMIAGSANGLITGATGVLTIPMVPYMEALKIERGALVQLMAMVFCRSALALTLAETERYDKNSRNLSMWAVAPALAGVFVGEWVRKRMSAARFRNWLLVALAGVGAKLALFGYAQRGVTIVPPLRRDGRSEHALFEAPERVRIHRADGYGIVHRLQQPAHRVVQIAVLLADIAVAGVDMAQPRSLRQALGGVVARGGGCRTAPAAGVRRARVGQRDGSGSDGVGRDRGA